MTTATCTDMSCPAQPAAGLDILRGVGLAVSVTVILIAPAALAVLALIQG